MEQKVSSSYYYEVLLLPCNCVCVCNLHVNCVSFVRVVVVVLLKLIDFQEERKLEFFQGTIFGNNRKAKKN